MIWESIVRFFVERLEAMAEAIEGLIPPPPAWISDAAGKISEAASYGALFGAWVPWGVVTAVLVVVVAVTVAAFAIRLVRIVASFATLGGGA